MMPVVVSRHNSNQSMVNYRDTQTQKSDLVGTQDHTLNHKAATVVFADAHVDFVTGLQPSGAVESQTKVHRGPTACTMKTQAVGRCPALVVRCTKHRGICAGPLLNHFRFLQKHAISDGRNPAVWVAKYAPNRLLAKQAFVH